MRLKSNDTQQSRVFLTHFPPNTVSYAGTMLGVEFRDSGAKRMSLREDLCARVNLLVKEVRKGDP